MDGNIHLTIAARQVLTATDRRVDHLRNALGVLVCGLLAQKDVTDVYLNPPERVGQRGDVWMVRHGEDPAVCGMMTADEAMRLVTAVAGTLDTTITKDRPFVEGELFGDGPRFEGLIPPAVLAPCWAIRNPASRVYTLAEYEARGDITARQRAILEDAVVRRLNIVAVGGTGSGKAQPDDSMVLTPTGFRRIADMGVGDLVLCPDGTTASVAGVYPQGEKAIHRVTFEDGRTVECCDDHLWKVWTKTSTYVRGSGRGAPKAVSMGWRVVPLSKIRGWFERGRNRVARTAVPLVAPCAIELPPQSLPIPPYALGALLGDGNICNGSAALLSSADRAILGRIEADLPDYEFVRIDPEKVDYRLRMKVQRKLSPLRVSLFELGLWGLRSEEKFVPTVYKRGSVAQRCALLQGLLDTDGSVGDGTHATFTSTSECLARDVQEIAWSLGAIAKIAQRQTHFRDKHGAKRAGRPSWRVSIVHPDVSSLFSLPRKVAQCRRKSCDHRLRIVSIEAVGDKPARCIAINHPERLYVTDNFVVTHNTTFLNAIAEAVARFTPAHRMLTIEGARELRIASRNKVQLRTAPGFDEHMALRAGLRLNIDRVWVGEVRGAEVLRMLEAWNTGHSGGGCSLHSDTATPDDALLRIEQMAAYATPAPQQRLISRLVNLIVCLERDDRGRRRVTQIVRVRGWDGTDYVLETER